MKLPALKQIRSQSWPTSASRTRSSSTSRSTCRFDARDTQRALRDSGIDDPAAADYAEKLWDYWERTLDPTSTRTAPSRAPSTARRSSSPARRRGIGRAAALKIAAAGGIPILVARTKEKLDEVKAEIEAAGGTRLRRAVRPERLRRDRRSSSRRCSPTTPRIDMLVNNAGRSIRRSVALSYDRFHDYERTVHLNYLSPVKLMLALLPHMRDQGGGHIVNVSIIGVQTNPPRFSRLRRLQGRAGRVHARGELARRSATTSPSRRSTCRSCARR